MGHPLEVLLEDIDKEYTIGSLYYEFGVRIKLILRRIES